MDCQRKPLHSAVASEQKSTYCCDAGFDPSTLSIAVTEFTLYLAAEPAFVAALAADRDYDEAVLAQFHAKVAAGELGEYEHASRLDQLMQQVTLLHCPYSVGSYMLVNASC